MSMYRFELKPNPDYVGYKDDYQNVLQNIASSVAEEVGDACGIQLDVEKGHICFSSAWEHRKIKSALKPTFSHYFDTVRYVDLSYR